MAIMTISGEVVSINIKGRGQNSAQILFVVRTASNLFRALAVTSYPAFEPQIFNSFSTLLCMAYAEKETVRVTFEESYPTDLAFEIEVMRVDRQTLPDLTKTPSAVM